MATKAAQPATRKRTSTAKKAAVTAKPSGRPTSRRKATGEKAVALRGPSQPPASVVVVEQPAAPRRPVAHALLAAERAVRSNSMQVQLPIIGEVQLPGANEIAFVGGVAALALIGVLEWPVAVLLGVGHGLATARHNKLIRAFGEALEEA